LGQKIRREETPLYIQKKRGESPDKDDNQVDVLSEEINNLVRNMKNSIE
jgi:hypothetical protein